MNIMIKPTIAEIKEKYKKANDVKSLDNNDIFEIDFESINQNMAVGFYYGLIVKKNTLK